MIRKLLYLLIIPFFVATGALAEVKDGYNFISAADLQQRLKNKAPMILVDICVVEQFAKGHIPGSIETNAYPVETAEQRQSLAKVLPQIKSATDDVIIICPRGGGGAKKTYDFYKSQGVDEKRLLILEKGMDKWPYETEAK